MTYLGNNLSVVSIINNSQNATLSAGVKILDNASNNSYFMSDGETFPFINKSIMINVISVKGDGDANLPIGKITINNNNCITPSVGTSFSPQGNTISNNCSGLIIGSGLTSNLVYSVNDTGDQSLAGFFNNVNIMLKD